MTDRIFEISAKLKLAREAYYNLNSELTDSEYDALKDELKELDPFNEEVIAIGFPAPKDGVWTKIAHEIPMGSLNKVNSIEEFKNWASKTGSEKFSITHKIDGSSLEVIYDNGNLIRAVSRGDGITGEDITINAIKVPNIPKKINSKEHLIIRGEIVMLKETFESKYSQEYANPRNTAAGKIREQKSNEACADLNFLAYTLIGLNLKSELSQFDKLKSLGFQIPDYLVGNIDDMCNYFTLISNLRSSVPFQIDGQVISIYDLSIQKSLGSNNLRPEGQRAWKFEPSMRESKIIDIVWQVGNSGRITPVAIIEPVDIMGVQISNISLHNLNLFRNLNLFKECKILVSRRADCIPYLECVLETN